MKRIVITGGAGFIGSNLVQYLSQRDDCAITVVDDESLGRRSDVEPFGIHFVKGDFRDPTLMEPVLKDAHTLVHFAADTRVMDSIADPDRNFEINVVGSYKLLRMAQTAGVRQVINASTGGAILGEAPAPVHEEMPARPLAPYGASKLAVEGYCSAFAGAYGLHCASLRFSNIFGPRSYHKGSVVAHFFKAILNHLPITVYGDGSQIRDYLFVGDLVIGITKAMDGGVNGVFQLGSGRPVTLNQLIDTMRQVVGSDYPLDVRYADFRPGEIRETWCDISKSRNGLGFSPDTSLFDGLSQTWTWFREAHADGRLSN